MALYYHTSLFLSTVYKWQVPGEKRILNSETLGDDYLLNTNSLDGIRDRSVLQVAKSSMYYFDNPFDYRCNSHYMVTEHSLAQIIAHMDLAMTHQHITLPIFPKDDESKATVDRTFKVADIAYARDKDYQVGTDTHAWIHIRDNEAFKVHRYLVNLSIVEILALVA
jgi:hypothetical protein